MKICNFIVFLLVCGMMASVPAQAAERSDPSLRCNQAIAVTERKARVPPQLLHSIAVVESGRRDPRTGMIGPWPWTINAEGTGFFFETKDQAIAAVQTLQARGVQSIDVGCMQINLLQHVGAFPSLEQAFEPLANVTYAAHFLDQLFLQTSTWPKAAAAYHSQTPEIGADYLRRVMALWPLGQAYAESPVPDALSKQYTTELAGRMANEASERARLYADMRGAAGSQRSSFGYPSMPVAPHAKPPSSQHTRMKMLAMNSSGVAVFLPTRLSGSIGELKRPEL